MIELKIDAPSRIELTEETLKEISLSRWAYGFDPTNVHPAQAALVELANTVGIPNLKVEKE